MSPHEIRQYATPKWREVVVLFAILLALNVLVRLIGARSDG